MKNILITGSAGFIGSFFFKYLTNIQNINLFGTINKNKGSFKKKDLKNKIFKCDLSEYKSTKELIDKIKPKVIFHFAGITNHNFSEKNKVLCKINNSKVINNIVKCINNECKLIFLSSDKVYSANPKISPEHTNLYPIRYLAKEKLKCERIIVKNTTKYFILRLPIVHRGGEQKKFSTIDNFLFLLKKNKKINVFKNVKRSFLKIDELNKLLEKLIYSKNYGIYNAGSKVFSYSERIEMLCKKNNIPTKNINKITGNIEPLIQNFDTKKLRKKFDIVFS